MSSCHCVTAAGHSDTVTSSPGTNSAVTFTRGLDISDHSNAGWMQRFVDKGFAYRHQVNVCNTNLRDLLMCDDC